MHRPISTFALTAVVLGGLLSAPAAAQIRVGSQHGSSKHERNAYPTTRPSNVHSGPGYGSGYPVTYKPVRHWIPGCWVMRNERFWVAERCEQVWRAAIYETSYDHCGHPITVCVQPAGWITVTHPGYWEWRQMRVFEAGHWSC